MACESTTRDGTEEGEQRGGPGSPRASPSSPDRATKDAQRDPHSEASAQRETGRGTAKEGRGGARAERFEAPLGRVREGGAPSFARPLLPCQVSLRALEDAPPSASVPSALRPLRRPLAAFGSRVGLLGVGLRRVSRCAGTSAARPRAPVVARVLAVEGVPFGAPAAPLSPLTHLTPRVRAAA